MLRFEFSIRFLMPLGPADLAALAARLEAWRAQIAAELAQQLPNACFRITPPEQLAPREVVLITESSLFSGRWPRLLGEELRRFRPVQRFAWRPLSDDEDEV